MPRRKATWAILIWTGLMAIGILAAALGIGSDCAGLAGSALDSCRAESWIGGGIGLSLLLILWLIGLAPLALVWYVSRPKEGVAL